MIGLESSINRWMILMKKIKRLPAPPRISSRTLFYRYIENLTLINRLPSVGDSQVNSVGIINVSMDNDY